MSTKKRAATKRLSSEGTGTGTSTANLEQQQQQHGQAVSSSTTTTAQRSTDASPTTTTPIDRERATVQENAAAVASRAAGGEGSSSPVAAAAGTDSGDSPRQVIAVSASKSPAAFFNLARKFLVTNEMCDLSALEGAIVSAVDAAHLLERSQLATIVRIHTSYVSVEPKRKKQTSHQGEQDVLLMQPSQSSPARLSEGGEVVATPAAAEPQAAEAARTVGEEAEASTLPSSDASASPSPATTAPQSSRRGSSGGRELRRARIVVTVRRTESYKRWLEENPLQAIIASEAEDETDETMGMPHPTGNA